MKKQVIVIGGGAAGFFCTANIDSELYDVTILEKQTKVLQKVKVSGGGRCNVTNASTDPFEMSKGYPRGSKAVRQAFAQFFTTDTKAWFQGRGVKLKDEKDGRVFPVSDNSEDIIHALQSEIAAKGFKVWTSTAVERIEKTEIGFNVITGSEMILQAHAVVIATGGYPKPEQYSYIKKLGHSVSSPVPSLFTFNIPDGRIHDIKGNSVEHVAVKVSGSSYISTGPILFTHWGFSGPAILKLSSYLARELSELNYQFSFSVNWLPLIKQDALRSELEKHISNNVDKRVVNSCPFRFSSGVWSFLCERSEINDQLKWREIKGKKFNVLIETLSNDSYKTSGKTTFKEEFVTCGGVDLKEIDFKTMQSKIVPGLYFAGEILDIDGITGGYNFQAAWTTGFIAAKAINRG